MFSLICFYEEPYILVRLCCMKVEFVLVGGYRDDALSPMGFALFSGYAWGE